VVLGAHQQFSTCQLPTWIDRDGERAAAAAVQVQPSALRDPPGDRAHPHGRAPPRPVLRGCGLRAGARASYPRACFNLPRDLPCTS